jgi:hypothetical protein
MWEGTVVSIHVAAEASAPIDMAEGVQSPGPVLKYKK